MQEKIFKFDLFIDGSCFNLKQGRIYPLKQIELQTDHTSGDALVYDRQNLLHNTEFILHNEHKNPLVTIAES